MLLSSYPYLFLLLPAAVLARDDFRTRRVGVVWLAVLGITAVVSAWLTQGRHAMAEHALCNALLLLLSAALLTLCLRLRGQRIGRAAGAGDGVFLLCVAPLFAPAEYMRFMIACCTAALVWWACGGRRCRTIPFVGTGGIVLAVWVAIQLLRL